MGQEKCSPQITTIRVLPRVENSEIINRQLNNEKYFVYRDSDVIGKLEN